MQREGPIPKRVRTEDGVWQQVRRRGSGPERVRWKRNGREDYLICEAPRSGYGKSGDEAERLFDDARRRDWTHPETERLYRLLPAGEGGPDGRPGAVTIRGPGVSGDLGLPEGGSIGRLTDAEIIEMIEELR